MIRFHQHQLFILFVFLIFSATHLVLSPAVEAQDVGNDAAPPADVVTYFVRLHEPHTQIVEIEAVFPDITTPACDVALPTWRPGKYLILDQAGSIRSITAEDEDGNALSIEKIRKSQWRISLDGPTDVHVGYSIYANSLGDRTRHVDETHAFLSGSAVFLYNELTARLPIRVVIDAPQDWQIASGLNTAANDARTLLADNYDVLVDSPIEVGLHNRHDFAVDGVPHEIIIWGDPGRYDAEHLITDFTALVEHQLRMWGRFPYQRYVFLIHAGRNAGGGTEHLNSTIMQTSREALEGSRERTRAYQRFLGLVSHEFFHTWNVKALRPADLVPYDYQSENYTTLLWVAEGTTSYYDDLFLARCDLIKPGRYLDILSGSITSLLHTPGRQLQSLEASSFDAWVKFNRSSPDDVNSTISFYSKGALVSFLLDMQIRKHTGNAASLDDVLRVMLERYPLEAGGYSSDNLIHVIEEVISQHAPEPVDIDTFFDAYVRGTEELPLNEALATVGLERYFDAAERDDDEDEDEDEDKDDDAADENEENDPLPEDDVEPKDADMPSLRAELGVLMGGRNIRAVRSDTPAFAAGLRAGDEIVAIADRRFEGSRNEIEERLRDFQPDDVVAITFFRNDELHTYSVTLAGVPDGTWKVRRMKASTEEQRKAYEDWLKQPWPADK
ncbi:MAG: M61 family metallopeptidase [Phycisphaerales bacterium]